MFAKVLGAGQTFPALELDQHEHQADAAKEAPAEQPALVPPSVDSVQEELPRRSKRERDGAQEQQEDLLRQIRWKAERIDNKIVHQGLLLPGPGTGVALPWAILRPADASEVRRRFGPGQRRKPEEAVAVLPGPDLLRRLRKLRTPEAKPGSAEENGPGLEDPALIEKAAQLLTGLLQAEGTEDVALTLAKAFFTLHGGGARRRLLALSAALKSNEALRKDILAAGSSGALAIARQDPREWACSDLQAKRQRWALESMQEAKMPSGQMARCPECGGKAFVNTGRAGSGRAARLSKQYAHFKCTEPHCGKETHLQEG